MNTMLDVCRCWCHTNHGIQHVTPCCYDCTVCDRQRIPTWIFKVHEEDCKERLAEMPLAPRSSVMVCDREVKADRNCLSPVCAQHGCQEPSRSSHLDGPFVHPVTTLVLNPGLAEQLWADLLGYVPDVKP